MSRELKAIEKAAMAWAGRRDAGLNTAQQAEFARWLRADPRHAKAFARLDGASRALDRLAALRAPAWAGAETRPDPDLALRSLRPSRRRSFGLPAGLVAAAALAIAALGWWRETQRTASFSRTFATDVGGLHKMALPDGSTIDLNTDTEVAVRFTAAERRVRLARGEAKFEVAKNPARPFIVDAVGVAVRAVGTAFDVRLRGESVEVLVTEGRVRVNDAARGASLLASPPAPAAAAAPGNPAAPAEPPVLAAGQRAVIAVRSGAPSPIPARVAPIAPAEIAQMLAWEGGRLEFDPTELGSLVAEFNRYNRRKLVIADPAIAGLKVGGSFRVDDCDAFVRLLESSFGVAATRSQNEVVLRARR